MGVNFALNLQRNKLDVAFAVQTFRAKYPAVTHFKLFDYGTTYIAALVAAGATHLTVAVPNNELLALQTPGYAEVCRTPWFPRFLWLAVCSGRCWITPPFL